MIQRCLFVFLLAIVPAIAADPLVISSPEIVDGQVSKSKFSKIAVVATNSSSAEPLSFVWISVERKERNGKFCGFRTDILCPCSHKCDRRPFRLKKGDSVSGSWDYRSSECEVATPGVYRFVVIARYSESMAGYDYHGMSTEFTITE